MFRILESVNDLIVQVAEKTIPKRKLFEGKSIWCSERLESKENFPKSHKTYEQKEFEKHLAASKKFISLSYKND